ncbi:MAG: hypothetical protein ABIN69_03015 [Aestuariivirga sp.]|jgi:hypothetical protein
MKTTIKIVFCATMTMTLVGCSSLNVFKDSNPPQTAVEQQPIAPQPGMSSVLNAAQIKQLLIGKSWRWKGPNNSGVTLYAADGSSLVEVTGKGTTGGKWEAKDGQLCESFSPAPFLPQGVPMSCQPFTGSNGNFMVGQASFNLAS